MLIILDILIFFWFKLIYTCTQEYVGCLIIVSGCSATFQVMVLSDTDGTFFFTFLVSPLFQAWIILARITWSLTNILHPHILVLFYFLGWTMCLSAKYLQDSYLISILPLSGFFLGGSFQKSCASNHGERSSAWASRGAQQDTGILSWSSDLLSVCWVHGAMLVKALSFFQLFGIWVLKSWIFYQRIKQKVNAVLGLLIFFSVCFYPYCSCLGSVWDLLEVEWMI